MKKSSLMGASVVAAALLAAAPVVAPVASLATPATQEVKADAQSDRDEAINKIQQQSTGTTLTNDNPATVGSVNHFVIQMFGNINDLQAGNYISKTDPKRISDADSAIRVNGTNLATNNPFLSYFLNGSRGVDLITTANAAAANDLRYTLRFDYSGAIGTASSQVKSSDDVNRLRHDLTTNGGKITMTMQLYDGSANKLSNGVVTSTVSYNVNNNRAAYVSYNDSLNAKVNDSASIFGLSNSFVNGGGKILNYNGQDITQAAYDAGAITVTPLLDSNNHLADASGAIVDNNFVRKGTYYQTIRIDLGAAHVDVPDNQWADAVDNGLITVNGQKPSLNNADAKVFLTTPGHTTVDQGQIGRAGVLVLKRTVNVGSANLATKDEKVNGVVTVNTSDITTAPLYDEAGNVIVDRSLPNKSRWQTDIKRTVYANGQVFYRVSTHEYIRADQVTFTANDASNSSDSTIKGDVVVTPSEGVFTMDHLGALLWSKSDDNNSMTVIADRYLPAKSAWRADKKAVVNGNTFYRVSTNEWVKADKGTFVAK